MQQREKRHLGGLEETQKWEFLRTACPDVDAECVCEGGGVWESLWVLL